MEYFKGILLFLIKLSIFSGIFWFFLPLSCAKQNHVENIGASSNFLVKSENTNGNASYGCVRLRRGDIIKLTGGISFLKNGNTQTSIITTDGGRIFILKGMEYPSAPHGRVTIKGKIFFEGNQDRLPELDLIEIEQ